MANGDLMEIHELYEIALTVLMMNIGDAARSAVSGKPDEQDPLAFPLCVKFISSQDDSQALVPAGEHFSPTHLPPLNLFSSCLWRSLISLQQKL